MRIAASRRSSLLASGCGKEPDRRIRSRPAYYGVESRPRSLRRLPMARGGLTVKGHDRRSSRPEQRSKNRGDFVEIFLNGERVGRYNVAKLPDGTWPRVAIDVDFNSGPNTFDVWDSSSNKLLPPAGRHPATRASSPAVPTADGYDIQQINEKIEIQ